MAEDGGDPFDGLYFTTRGESDARAARLLPAEPSEDMSSLMTVPPEIAEAVADDEEGQLPEPSVEWIVRVDLDGEARMHRQEVLDLFDRDWLEAHGHPTFYGFDPDNAQWVYLHAVDAPVHYSKLQLAWRLLPFDAKEVITADIIRGWIAAMHTRVEGRGRATMSQDPESAARRALELRELSARCDQHVEVFVVAPEGSRFDGRIIWDIMLCLGLRWGDMDLFHWTNPGPAGDDALFSVATTTEPGYFLPEEVAANRVHVDDVAFTFSIARCAAPLAIFETLLRAAGYVQARLGGALHDGDGPLDPDRMRAWIKEVSVMLERAGFPPGAPLTMMIF